MNASEFRQQYAGGQRNFTDLELYDSDLSGIELEKINLHGATPVQVVLNGARFGQADLREAEITECSAREAIFEDVDFDNAQLLAVDFERARFRRCSFRGTSWDQCSLVRTVFEDCSFKNTHFSDVCFAEANMAGAVLEDVVLLKSAFDRSVLRGARLVRVEAHDIVATNTDFSGMNAPKQTFSDCDLRGSDFTGADLQGASISACGLAGVSLRNTNLRGANLDEQDLNHVDLFGATFDAKTRFPDGFDPTSAGAVRVKDELRARPRGNVSRAAFEKRWGKPKLNAALNALMEQARVPIPERPPIFNGLFYDTGFYRSGTSPELASHDWTALSDALLNAARLGEILQNQIESSAQDVPYFPFVVAPLLGEEGDWEPLEALSSHPWLDEGSADVRWVEQELDAKNAFVRIEKDDDLPDYHTNDALRAFEKATKWMNEHLTAPQRISLSGVRVHPTLWIGRTLDGLYVGLLTLRDDS